MIERQASFTLDLDRCTGCSACAIACTTENGLAEGTSWRQVYTFNEQRLPGAGVFHYSLACNHCLDPACMDGCPANAYTKHAGTGAVLLDPDRCIGCHYCAWVCPYDAPQTNPATGVMDKCTFCSHRLADGGRPACVTACPVDALGFAPQEAPGPIDHPGMPETGLGPALRVVHNHRRAAGPVMTAASEVTATPRRPATGFALRTEWSLMTFTYLAACLVAWFAAGRAKDVPFDPLAFLVVGVSAMGISLLHLGRPGRAWRAISNLRRSWVSREVFFYPAFLVWAAASGAFGPGGDLVGGFAVVLGFAALFSMDMVYRVAGQSTPPFPHSAMTTLTAALLIGLLTRDPWLAAPVGTLKLALYLARATRETTVPWLVSAARLVFGFAWPLSLWRTEAAPLVLVAGPLLGELIDRAEFYSALEFPNPRLQIALDLRRLAGRVTGARAS